MKLYTSIGPNPRVVRMVLAEKRIEIPCQRVDLVGGENRQPAFLAINPAGQLPVLELASGQAIAESMAICEYLEETHSAPPLIGDSAPTRASVRMWTRRIDLAYVQPVTAAFRFGPALRLFQSRVYCIPLAAEDMANMARQGEMWIEAQLGERPYLAGDRFSLADLVLYCFVDFAARRAGLPLDPSHTRLAAWFERINQRDSAQATAAETYGRAGAAQNAS